MVRFATNEIQAHEIEHAKIVREHASEGTLFLKRNRDFPIQPCKVNLYGSGARRTIKGGKGSGDVNTRYSSSIEEGLKGAGFEVATTAWMDEYDRLVEESVSNYWTRIQKEAEEQNTSPYVLVMFNPKPPVSYEMKLEGDGEVNIYVIARDTSEGMDRLDIKGDFQLLDCEVSDIKYLAKQDKKLLLVLNVGGVLDISPILNDVDNILLLSQLGAETGQIFADIITGKSVPSGKLTTTWSSLPEYSSTPWFGTEMDVEYKEGRYVGYRYFDSFKRKPQFAFGFGLGYTDFSFEPENFEADGSRVFLTVNVKNIGHCQGKEVIQAYYTKVGNSLGKQLIAFSKTEMLKAGENQVLNLSFDICDASEYAKEQSAFVLGQGEYQIHIGNCIENTVCMCSILIEEDFVTESVHKLTSVEVDELKCPYTQERQQTLLGEKVLYPEKIKEEEQGLYESKRIKGMSKEELIRMCVGVLNDMTLDNNIGNSGKKVAGAAGETYSDDTIAPLVLADGTSGLRISPSYKLDEEGRVKASRNALAGMLPGGALEYQEEDEETYYQYCTAIPIGTALAQTWNVNLCETIGNVVGKEMELFDVDIWLAPALNIQRNPLCGRNFEYYSEDPLVSGIIAAAITAGVQKNKGRSVTIKHFCCNNQETDRFFSNSIMTEKTLREIYLKGFEICIKKSHPKALMSSYNLLNGTHTANSEDVLNLVLRDEWKYDGLVMTDWLCTGGLGIGKKYGPATARGCILASNDLIMPGRDEDYQDILEAVNAGEITRTQLETCANRVLRLAEETHHE